MRDMLAAYDKVFLQQDPELRHSFVSLLSDADVPIEHISRLVGHSSTTTTETIYRKQIRPVIIHGADIMDRIFPGEADHDA